MPQPDPENGETSPDVGSAASRSCLACGLEVADAERAVPLDDLMVAIITGKEPTPAANTPYAHASPALCTRALAAALRAAVARTTHLERRVDSLELRERARGGR